MTNSYSAYRERQSLETTNPFLRMTFHEAEHKKLIRKLILRDKMKPEYRMYSLKQLKEIIQ